MQDFRGKEFGTHQPGEQHWEIFNRLCTQADARGHLEPDARFAALAIESGCNGSISMLIDIQYV